MHIWKAASQPLKVQVGPMRPHVFGSRLHFRDQQGVTEIPGNVQADGTVVFDVTQAQVDDILNHVAFLFVTTRHVLHPGSADLRWGWRYKLTQKGDDLSAIADQEGNALVQDTDGFVNSALEPFDEPVEISRETITFQ